MIGPDELVRRFAELNSHELARWIENRWVVPEHSAESEGVRWVFHEVDVARVELILDIRREFAVDDEAMSLVLGLLDQVYSLRRQMRRLCDALEQQPPASHSSDQSAPTNDGSTPDSKGSGGDHRRAPCTLLHAGRRAQRLGDHDLHAERREWCR